MSKLNGSQSKNLLSRPHVRYVARKRERWLTAEVSERIDAKKERFEEWLASKEENKDATYQIYKEASRACLKATRKAKKEQINKKCMELEADAKAKNTRAVYQKVKELKGVENGRGGLLRDEMGNLILDARKRKERWKGHFEKLLNAGRDVSVPILNEEINETAEEPAPTEIEVLLAIGKLKNRKAAGYDEMFAEYLKRGGDILTRKVYELIVKIWNSEEIPEDWRKSIIVPLFKKGDRSMCDNWRGISLLSVVGKVFTNIILERLSKSVDEKLSENQAGFRKERGCSDQIFTLRRIMEQAKAENITMHMCFIDLKAAYDTVNKKALFSVLPLYKVS